MIFKSCSCFSRNVYRNVRCPNCVPIARPCCAHAVPAASRAGCSARGRALQLRLAGICEALARTPVTCQLRCTAVPNVSRWGRAATSLISMGVPREGALRQRFARARSTAWTAPRGCSAGRCSLCGAATLCGLLSKQSSLRLPSSSANMCSRARVLGGVKRRNARLHRACTRLRTVRLHGGWTVRPRWRGILDQAQVLRSGGQGDNHHGPTTITVGASHASKRVCVAQL